METEYYNNDAFESAPNDSIYSIELTKEQIVGIGGCINLYLDTVSDNIDKILDDSDRFDAVVDQTEILLNLGLYLSEEVGTKFNKTFVEQAKKHLEELKSLKQEG